MPRRAQLHNAGESPGRRVEATSNIRPGRGAAKSAALTISVGTRTDDRLEKLADTTVRLPNKQDVRPPAPRV